MRLRRQPGLVSKTDDSAVLLWRNDFPILEDGSAREGETITGLKRFGELDSADASFGQDRVIFSGHLITDGSAKRALFYRDYPTPNAIGLESSDTTQPRVFRQFAGHTTSTEDWTLFSATLARGNAVSRRNDQALMAEKLGDAMAGQHLVFQKNEALSALAPNGPRLKRVLGFWPLQGPGAMILCQMTGPGITKRNDVALWCWGLNGIELILQKGTQIGDLGEGTSIRAIDRVDVMESGDYAVLVRLTGSASRNQLLLNGNCMAGALVGGPGAPGSALNKPRVILRKGETLDDGTGTLRKLTGLSLGEVRNRFGAGGGGRKHLLNENGDLAVTLNFGKKHREVQVLHAR